MQAIASNLQGSDVPEGFNPVESAARFLRRTPGGEFIVGVLLLGIVLVLDRARKAALAEMLDRAPIDDEPLSDEERAILADPIDYAGAMRIGEFRESLRADRTAVTF